MIGLTQRKDLKFPEFLYYLNQMTDLNLISLVACNLFNLVFFKSQILP